jgi:hypothetical protein
MTMSEPVLPEQTLVQLEPLKISREPASPLAVRPSVEKWLQFGQHLTEAIDRLPLYWETIWQAYKRPVYVLAWIGATLVTLKITLAVLGAIHEIPLLPAAMQLVGLGYAGWFAARNLVSFVSRQEFFSQLKGLRKFIWG